jgi:ribonuclease HI
VAGHAGDALNERCDQLSTQAMQGDNLRVDEVYEANQGVQGKLF